MMRAPQEEARASLRFLVLVTRAEDEIRLEELLDNLRLPLLYQCRGKGTAPSEMLDIFGLSGTTRQLTIGIVPRESTPEIFAQVQRRLSVHQRGRGIAITIPVTGLQSPVLHLLGSQEEARHPVRETTREEVSHMEEKSEYVVIWASVASGFSDDVVDAARSAGAKGGTVLKGRRRNTERLRQQLGLSVQEGQEFVMIVAPKAKKSAIMSAICDACGLRTAAHGVVLSLPVEEAIGLEG